jgi:molybdopterin synthase sulfur carrier subunit
MSVTVRIPASLRKFCGGNDTVAVNGSNVGEVLEQLEAFHPGVKSKLCDDSGNIRRFINIYADAEDIRFLDNLATEVQSEVEIIPAIAGGF